MERIIVAYGSKYGTSQRYAQWLAQDLDCLAVSAKEVSETQLKPCDIVVWGGGIYASSILGAKGVKQYEALLLQKRLLLFTVGLADPKIKEPFLPILEKNFSESILQHASIYHFRGGIDYQRLGKIHRAMMAMLLKMVKNKPQEQLSQDDRMMIKTYGGRVDFCNHESILPMLEEIRAHIK